MVSRLLQRSRRSGVWSSDALTLGAIAVVVLLVSLPRLSDFVVRANEGDARSTLLVLGGTVFAGERAVVPTHVADLVETNASLEHQLQDARRHGEGRVLEHHGYLFELVHDETGKPVLCAWPRETGTTGVAAYLYDPERGLRKHPNADGSWSGLTAPPDALLEAAWSRARQ